MLGFHFAREPKQISIKDLSPGVIAKILDHVELVVEQLAAAPVADPIPDPQPPVPDLSRPSA